MPNIILVGFMGTGKSSVGKKLAEVLQRRLVNTDDLIVLKTKMSINDIFQQKGESYFRERESEVVREVSQLKDVVIDAGGGVVINESNVKALKENGIIICLSATADTILRRIKGETHRPLLDVKDPLSEITRLLKKREGYYKRADYHIDTAGKSVEQVAQEIIEISNSHKRASTKKDIR